MARKKAKDDQPQKKEDRTRMTNGDGPPKQAPPAPVRISVAEPPGPTGAMAATQAQLTVLAQYIKDLSFESPQAPQSLQGPGQNPSSRSASM